MNIHRHHRHKGIYSAPITENKTRVHYKVSSYELKTNKINKIVERSVKIV